MVKLRLAVVGSGISGLVAADAAARAGYEVVIYEQRLRADMRGGHYRAASPMAFAMELAGSFGEGKARTGAESAHFKWLELKKRMALSERAYNHCGWMSCAQCEDSEAAIRWYYEQMGRDWGAVEISGKTIMKDDRYEAIRGAHTRYALFDPHAAAMHPPQLLKEISGYLADKVQIRFGTRVVRIEGKQAVLDCDGKLETVTHDAYLLTAGLYTELFPEFFKSLAFRRRYLQMHGSILLPMADVPPWMTSGRTTAARYGNTLGAPSMAALRRSIPEELLRIDGNVMTSTHPSLNGGWATLHIGDTHGGEGDDLSPQLGHYALLRKEAMGFLAPAFVPRVDQLEDIWVGSYPYLEDQGPLAEDPVCLRVPGMPVVAYIAPKGRGHTYAPEGATLCLAEVSKIF